MKKFSEWLEERDAEMLNEAKKSKKPYKGYNSKKNHQSLPGYQVLELRLGTERKPRQPILERTE